MLLGLGRHGRPGGQTGRLPHNLSRHKRFSGRLAGEDPVTVVTFGSAPATELVVMSAAEGEGVTGGNPKIEPLVHSRRCVSTWAVTLSLTHHHRTIPLLGYGHLQRLIS